DAEWMGIGWYCSGDGSEEHHDKTDWVPCPDDSSAGAKYFKRYSDFKEYKQNLKLAAKLVKGYLFVNGFNKKKKSNRRKRKR
ncbi:unnamed protein product, partial [marine sediment metagenome]